MKCNTKEALFCKVCDCWLEGMLIKMHLVFKENSIQGVKSLIKVSKKSC